MTNEVERIVMRHWTLLDNMITLSANDRIVSIERRTDGTFTVGECCDDWFGQNYSKQEIIDLLNEALRFAQSTDV